MPKPYLSRLIAIEGMLNSRLSDMKQEAHELLFELWLEYNGRSDFSLDFRQLVENHPSLSQEMEARYQKELKTTSEDVETIPVEKEFKYDVFISYSHKDRKWVQNELLPRLEAKGMRVCLDFRDFEPGAPSLAEMERAVVQSHKTILVLTPNYVESEWGEFENILAQNLDPAARMRRIVPILLESCELPLRIQALVYLDFTDANEAESQFSRLMNSISSKDITTRTRLATPTTFAEASDKPNKVLVTPRLGITTFLVALIAVWMWSLFQKSDPIIWTVLPGITVSYIYPTYLSMGDQNTINVTVANASPLEFDEMITLIFQDPAIIPIADQSLSVKFTVPSHGRETKQFKFLLAENPSAKNIDFYFHISRSDGSVYKSDRGIFLVTPIPYLRSAWLWVVSSSGIVALIIAFFWERMIVKKE